ncbi:MAG: FKBP-type peptidyl-prolyl cis-trans isomerase [Fimbriimonadales bacterium]
MFRKGQPYRSRLGLSVCLLTTLCAGALSGEFHGKEQTPKQETAAEMLARLDGKFVSYEKDPTAYDNFLKFLRRSFPKANPVFDTLGDSQACIWRRGTHYLVFKQNAEAIIPGESSVSLYYFDLNGKPISTSWFGAGWRTWIHPNKVIQVPGVSDFLIDIEAHGWGVPKIREVYGLIGDRVVIVRLEQSPDHSWGTSEKYSDAPVLARNTYWAPNITVGPLPPTYSKESLLAALQGHDNVAKLEALTWLAGIHAEPSEQINPVFHEPQADAQRYWALSREPEVVESVRRLESSPVPWISEAAKLFLTSRKDLTISKASARRITDKLIIEDLVIGKGTEFTAKGAVLKQGDRAVMEYEATLPDGTVFDSNKASNVSPVVVTAGDKAEIVGLSQGIIGMRPGGTRRLTIPSALAFGSVGTAKVPPNSDVLYTVKLLQIDDSNWQEAYRIRDVKAGSGTRAKDGMKATIHWRAWLINGKPISKVKLANPATFILGDEHYGGLSAEVIGMRVGGLRRTLVKDIMFSDSTSFGYDYVVVEVKLDKLTRGPGSKSG